MVFIELRRFIQPEEFKEIEGIVKKIIKSKRKFERIEVPKEAALDIFSYNKYKIEIINDKVPDGGFDVTIIDVCRELFYLPLW